MEKGGGKWGKMPLNLTIIACPRKLLNFSNTDHEFEMEGVLRSDSHASIACCTTNFDDSMSTVFREIYLLLKLAWERVIQFQF